MRFDNVLAKEKKNIIYYDMKNNLFKKERLARYNFASKFACNTVLEVGCGARDGAFILSKYAGNVVAIDISKEAIEFAKRNYSARNVEYMTMDCLDMAFEDNSFDTVVSLEVIEHVSDGKLCLKNIKRVLRGGGLYIGSTINRERNGLNSAWRHERHHLKEYSASEYRELLSGHFKNIEIMGQFLKKDISSGVDKFRDGIRRIDPFYIRRLLPAGFKDVLLDLVRKINGSTPLGEIREEDFYFTASNIRKARHFIAVCKK